MKFTQMMLGAAVAAAMAFGAATASAVNAYPNVALAISGTVFYSPNPGHYQVQAVPLKRVAFTTASLIALLNASEPVAQEIYTDATIKGVANATTQIPPGSYFLWNIAAETIDITNKNGFFMAGSDLPGLYLDVDDDNLVGTYSLNAALGGTETDVTGISFGFDDGNNNQIYIYGRAILSWAYGAASAGAQRATLTVYMTGGGTESTTTEINDYPAVATYFAATGSGSITGFPTANVPFFWWW